MKTTSQSNQCDQTEITGYCHRRNHKFTFAVLLILAGILFLGFNIGLIPIQYKQLIFSLPMLFIALGVIAFSKRKLFVSLVLIGLGLFFLIPVLGRVEPRLGAYIRQDFARVYWPAILVIAGLLILFRKLLFPNRFTYFKQREENNKYHGYHRGQWKQDCCGRLDSNNLFGSGEHIVLDSEFKGGEINTAFGQTILDLRKTTLPEGETILEVNAAFGGVVIYVPADWNVKLHTNSFFGGFSDSRESKPDLSDNSKALVIVGSCAFGGGELKN